MERSVGDDYPVGDFTFVFAIDLTRFSAQVSYGYSLFLPKSSKEILVGAWHFES
ncbi:MAG: hypothetical protein H7318_10425 [Oligoflexus sp.]|nr:hypothetical protein [Oligoflexus sp.]